MQTLPAPQSEPLMARKRRLSRPDPAVQWAILLDPKEAEVIEDRAHELRVSVAAWLRVALVEASRHPERIESWRAVLGELAGDEDAEEKPAKAKRPKK